MLQEPVQDRERLLGVSLSPSHIRTIDSLIGRGYRNLYEKNTRRSAIIKYAFLRGIQSLLDEQAGEVKL